MRAGGVRLTADIIEPGRPTFHTFIEVEEEYAKYLSVDRADYLLYLVFPIAIREGYDVVCEAPITEMLLHNIREILIPHFLIGDENAKPFDIYADTTDELSGGKAVGTAISCGVDSMFSVMMYTSSQYKTMNLTHLFVGSINAELWDFDEQTDDLFSWEEKHKYTFDRINSVAQMTGLPVVKMFTNVIWYVCRRDWNVYHHLYTHHYITMASVLALRHLWKIYYFASTFDFISKFERTNWLKTDPEHMTLMGLHILSLPDFQLFSSGVEFTREEKTKQLIDYEPARKNLHPCHKQGEKNCTDPWCSKCLRALSVLDHEDRLDDFSAVFDIERYKKNKRTYMWFFAQWRNDEFIEPCYKLMCEKYPEEMKKVTEDYENWRKPIPREIYDVLNFAHSVTVRMLGVDDLQGKLNKFFKERGISKLYCSGYSNFGNKIRSMIEQNIECVTYRTGKFNDCDGGLILTFDGAERTKIKKALGNSKPIYTIEEIEKSISEMK